MLGMAGWVVENSTVLFFYTFGCDYFQSLIDTLEILHMLHMKHKVIAIKMVSMFY